MLIPFNGQHTHSTSYKDIQMLTQAELQSRLNYNSITGIFTWKNPPRYSNKKDGDNAGWGCHGYIMIKINNKTYSAHRLAWLYMYNYLPPIIDHINGNPSDNRISNLRPATLSKNQQNSKIPKSNTSGIKGVSWHKATKKWRATLNINGKLKHLGVFDDIKSAELIVREARIKYHGEFANHG